MDDRLRETQLNTQRVYNGAIVKLDVDRVRLPDGREARREVVRHAGAVVVIPVLADGRVLMVRQFRYAVGQVVLEFPAGTLDHAAESPEACAHRELEEETGHQAGRMIRLGDFFTTPGFTDELMYAFVAEDLTPAAQNLDSDEFIEVVAVSWPEVWAKVAANQIHDAKTLAALCLYQAQGSALAGAEKRD
jgi:ADP-ribose pyrophosphatase